MTISSYTELKASIAANTHRADTAAMVDEWIDSTEARINRRLRIRAMEDVATGNFTANDPALALPTGFLEARTFTYEPISGMKRKLVWLTPDQAEDLNYGSARAPDFYTYEAGEITLFATPDQAYPYTLNYYKAIPALSGSVATNDVLTNWPDLYLYGAMIDACMFYGRVEEVMLWRQGFEDVMREVQRHDNRSRSTAPIAQFDGSLPNAAGKANILMDG